MKDAKTNADEQHKQFTNALNVEKNKLWSVTTKLKMAEDDKIKMEQTRRDVEDELRREKGKLEH